MTGRVVIILLLTIILQATNLMGQYSVDELDSVSIEQHLYNGRFKNAEFYNVTGSEYIVEDGWANGTLVLNNNLFNSVDFNYDLVNDYVVSPYKTRGNIIINPSLLQSFSFIHNGKMMKFVRINSPKTTIDGFAELIYDGSIKLYKKRRKTVVFYDVAGSYGFRTMEQILLQNDQGLTRLKNSGDLLKLYKDQRADIKKFIRDNRIRFKIDDPYQLIPLLDFIEKSVANED